MLFKNNHLLKNSYQYLLFLINDVTIQHIKAIIGRVTLGCVVTRRIISLKTMAKDKSTAAYLVDVVNRLADLQIIQIDLTGLLDSINVVSNRSIGGTAAMVITGPAGMNSGTVSIDHKLVPFRPITFCIRH